MTEDEKKQFVESITKEASQFYEASFQTFRNEKTSLIIPPYGHLSKNLRERWIALAKEISLSVFLVLAEYNIDESIVEASQKASEAP